MILNLLHKNNTQLIICGDFNINYLAESNKKTLLDSLLVCHNLTNTIHFPTRIQNKSATAIDNIFIDTSTYNNYVILPIINGLSDHDAQMITINDIHLKVMKNSPCLIRRFSELGISDFRIRLSLETWDNVFDNTDMNSMYNSFLNTYLRAFYTSFPLKN
jgi:hypothetical protein